MSGGLWRQRVAVANEEMSPLEVRWGMIIFFLSPDVHGCRWGIAKPYSIRSRLKERICWEVHFSQMRANPHFRDGRSLDKAVADMALPSADNGFTL